MGEHRWLRASRREPCAVCGKPDYCTRSADGTLVCCMRVESRWLSKNKLGGWLHKLNEPLPVVVVEERVDEPAVEWGELAMRLYEAGRGERQRLSNSLGVPVAALEELHVGLGYDEYRHSAFSSWPERSAGGAVVGIVRRYPNGVKKMAKGGHHGLYFGNHPLAMPGPVLLPEGGTDTAALMGMGLNAVGRPSNTGGVCELVKFLKGIAKQTLVLGERDRKDSPDCKCGVCMKCWPGLAGARMTAERLAAVLKTSVEVRMFPNAKDARQWVNQHDGAVSVDAIAALDYSPVKDACRVCGNLPPHEARRRAGRIETVCLVCRCLLENTEARS